MNQSIADTATKTKRFTDRLQIIKVEEVKKSDDCVSEKSEPQSTEGSYTGATSPTLKQEQELEILKGQVCFMLQDDAPRKKYERTQNWEKKKHIIHWGQRKLFMSELWFLTKYGHLATCVVYAGAAPGTHIPFLVQLFPKHHFILFDPSNFDLKNLKNDKTNAKNRMVIRQEYFTDEIAAQLAKDYPDNILFISDIRTADPGKHEPELSEILVYNDNIKQKDWINIMKPKKSLVTLKYPYPDVKIGENLKCQFPNVKVEGENLALSMFKGEIFIQPYATPTGTETKLIPDDNQEEIQCDNRKYEEQLYYHNHVTREATYPQPINGEGLNETWDISVEIVILYDFLMKFPECYPNLSISIFDRIRKLSHDISRNITNTSRNLSTPMVHPEQRRVYPSFDHTSLNPDLKGMKFKLTRRDDPH